jgi:hypothetical protein
VLAGFEPEEAEAGRREAGLELDDDAAMNPTETRLVFLVSKVKT